MPSLVIGNKNYSSWSLRPWLVLKHLRVDFDEVQLALDTESFKPQLSRYSDAGRVPVWVDGELKIGDSLAICEYLAESHPSLWPEDRRERARARALVCEMHSGFTALRSELPMNCRAHQRQITLSVGAHQELQRIEQIWQQCADASANARTDAGAANNTGENAWLFGRFGIIDAFFAPVVIRLQGYQLELSPNTQAYIRQHLDNPLLQEWILAGKEETAILAQDEAGI